MNAQRWWANIGLRSIPAEHDLERWLALSEIGVNRQQPHGFLNCRIAAELVKSRCYNNNHVVSGWPTILAEFLLALFFPARASWSPSEVSPILAQPSVQFVNCLMASSSAASLPLCRSAPVKKGTRMSGGTPVPSNACPSAVK
jgi:hypothetical protein